MGVCVFCLFFGGGGGGHFADFISSCSEISHENAISETKLCDGNWPYVNQVMKEPTV